MSNLLKKKIIILEGVDGTGKSTLAEKISKDTGMKVVHVDGKFPNTYEAYENLIMGEMKNTSAGIILDRGPYGELLYGPIYRGFVRISAEEIDKLESLIVEKYELMKCICVRKPDAILDTYKVRGELEAKHCVDDINNRQLEFLKIMHIDTKYPCTTIKMEW